jgi:hypothetical protein
MNRSSFITGNISRDFNISNSNQITLVVSCLVTLMKELTSLKKQEKNFSALISCDGTNDDESVLFFILNFRLACRDVISLSQHRDGF